MKANVYFAVWVVVVSLILGLTNPANAQTVSTDWNVSYGEFYYDAPDLSARFIQPIPSGGFLLSGSHLVFTNAGGELLDVLPKTDIFNQSRALVATDDGINYVVSYSYDGEFYLSRIFDEHIMLWSVNLAAHIPVATINANQHDSDDGFLLCGKTINNTPWWCRFTKQGELDWLAILTVPDSGGGDYISSGYGEMLSIAPTTDGGCILSGYLGELPAILKTNPDGSVKWYHTMPQYNSGHSFVQNAPAILQKSDGSFAFCYNDTHPDHNEHYIVLVLADQDGNTLSTHHFISDNWDSYIATNMKQTLDGGYIITGYRVWAFSPDIKALIIKADSLGNEMWRQEFQGKGYDSKAYDILPLDSHTYVFCGTDIESYEDGMYGSLPWLVKIHEVSPVQADFSAVPLCGPAPLSVQFTDNSSGDITDWHWDFGDGYISTQTSPEHIFDESGVYSTRLVVSSPAGNDTLTRVDYITVLPRQPNADFIAGPLYGFAPLNVSFTDKSQGVIDSWSWDFGDGSVSDEQNPEHSFTLADSFSVTLRVSGPGGNSSLCRENCIHVMHPASVEENVDIIPHAFRLYQNYPNPFNPVTQISYDLPTSEYVRLSIYNVNGKLVKLLVNTEEEAGHHKVIWNANGLASGVYFINILAGTFQYSMKMLFVQ